MKRLTLLAAAAVVAGTSFASAAVMTMAPTDSWTVTNYYKQTIYDKSETKIGEVADVLVDKSGKVTGLVVSVGGFLGVGSKDVIVPFEDVTMEKKNDKYWLSVNETKDTLKAAPGFSYDRTSTTWRPEKT